MSLQADLFTLPDTTTQKNLRAADCSAGKTRVLAVPCGFLNGANRPCRRLGNLPVIIEGAALIKHGAQMGHCDPACFRSEAIPRST